MNSSKESQGTRNALTSGHQSPRNQLNTRFSNHYEAAQLSTYLVQVLHDLDYLIKHQQRLHLAQVLLSDHILLQINVRI